MPERGKHGLQKEVIKTKMPHPARNLRQSRGRYLPQEQAGQSVSALPDDKTILPKGSQKVLVTLEKHRDKNTAIEVWL